MTIDLSNPTVSVVLFVVDYCTSKPQLRMTYRGNTNGGVSLAPGVDSAFEITVTMDLTTGGWSSTNGMSGTADADALSALLAKLVISRNSADAFAVASGVIPGSAVSY